MSSIRHKKTAVSPHNPAYEISTNEWNDEHTDPEIVDVVGLQSALDALAGGMVPDGDKGDITVSGTGTVWTLDNGTVTVAKIAPDLEGYIIAMAAAL